MDDNNLNKSDPSIYYEILDGIVFIRVNQIVDVDDLLSMRQMLIEDPEFISGMPTLYDIRQEAVNVITKEHIRTIGDQTDSIIHRRGKHRTALLAGDDLSFGLSRMYEILGEHPDINLTVFRDEEEAINWLKEDDG